MSATPLSQHRSLLGIAQSGASFAASLVAVAVSIGLMAIALATGARLAVVIATVGLLVGAVGASAMAGASLLYRAWPSPRPSIGEALVWRPTLALRAAAMVTVVGLSTGCLAVVTIELTTPGLLSSETGWMLVWFVIAMGPSVLGFLGGRFLIARLEADRWGIRCTNLLTTVRIPWSDLRALEVRGKSRFTRRIVAVTEQGSERTLMLPDGRFPIARDGGRLLVAELEAVRRSAPTGHANAIE